MADLRRDQTLLAVLLAVALATFATIIQGSIDRALDGFGLARVRVEAERLAEEAEKEAQANVIRRREEANATRASATPPTSTHAIPVARTPWPARAHANAVH